jgi:hypothetical protein
MTIAASPVRSARRKADEAAATPPWAGPARSYDLVKEFVAALVVVTLLTGLLAAVFSSPDEKPVTIEGWAAAAPNDLIATAAAELDGTSATATYGAPYTHSPGAGQKLGPLPLQRWAGVNHAVDPAADFVINPLRGVPGDPALTEALKAWTGAAPEKRQEWASGYDQALQQATDHNPAAVAPADYGPVPVLLDRLLAMARSGGLDGALLAQGRFYQTDYTKPLLFIADGTYLEDQARAEHLGGDQWGVMNETGKYPGQPWMWLYTFWYQVKPFSTSDNADALVWGWMMFLTALFIFVPFIPGVRSIPRLVPVHKLIWRDWYRSQQRTPGDGAAT